MGEEISTVTIKRSLKRKLDEARGNDNWNVFLAKLYANWKKRRGRRAFNSIKEALTKKELLDIEESYKGFKKGFRLR